MTILRRNQFFDCYFDQVIQKLNVSDFKREESVNLFVCDHERKEKFEMDFYLLSFSQIIILIFLSRWCVENVNVVDLRNSFFISFYQNIKAHLLNGKSVEVLNFWIVRVKISHDWWVIVILIFWKLIIKLLKVFLNSFQQRYFIFLFRLT